VLRYCIVGAVISKPIEVGIWHSAGALTFARNSVWQVSLATLTRKMLQTSAVKLNVTTIGALAKFVIEMGAGNNYLDELAEHHSQSVNPTELTVSHTIFEAIVTAIPSENILLKLGLACASFTTEKVECRVRPMPDVARCFSPNDFSSLAKNTVVVQAAEKYLKDGHQTVNSLASPRARSSGSFFSFGPCKI
jgi:hypothetical protein